MTALLACLCAVSSQPLRAISLDTCHYPSLESARAVWTSYDGGLPVEVPAAPIGGRTALKLPCDVRGDHQRAYWDRAFDVDLSRADRFSFWLYLDDPAKIAAGLTVYFRSGSGWFRTGVNVEQGWNHVLFTKAQFTNEDTPTGWKHIDGLRISAWKSTEAATFLAIDDILATSSGVAVVMDPDEPTYADAVSRTLAKIGIDSGVVTDADVAMGALEGRRMAVFADNPRMTDSEVDQVESFQKAGGKLMAFYEVPARLLRDIGIEPVGYKAQEYAGQFGLIRATPGALSGLPTLIRQASWNVEVTRPISKGAKVVGEWCSAKGVPTGIPALITSDSGCYMSHVLLSDDPASKEQMMLALLGHLDPALEADAARQAVDRVGQVGEYHSFDEARRALAGSQLPVVRACLREATAELNSAKASMHAARNLEAVEAADRADKALMKGYCTAQPTKKGEMRAVWCHSAAGIAGQSWDTTVKKLAGAGFNMIMPNLLWGGLAYYKSALLPVDPSVSADGDRIAQCVAAGHKYGVKVHVWKVNWNLGNAPRSFLEKMRAQHRTQKDPTGGDIDWLCPSNPENQALERDSMLEIVRNYAVDGIHFDYIRYPGPEGCYCDGCRERFERQYGVRVVHWPQDVISGEYKAKYLAFRRDNITRLVAAVSQAARKIRPGIKISAAVFADYPQCRDTVGQDWPLWIRRGYLDFVCPMDYSPSAGQYEQWMKAQSADIAGARPFVPGVGVTLGDWTLTPDQVVRQILQGRKYGSAGFILFNLDDYLQDDVLPYLRLGVSAAR